MRTISFTSLAFQEYNDWFQKDLRIIQKIGTLIRDIENDPFKGLGKPDPLRGNWTGYWSRRIDHEHRLIYKVSADQITIVKCKGHY